MTAVFSVIGIIVLVAAFYLAFLDLYKERKTGTAENARIAGAFDRLTLNGR